MIVCPFWKCWLSGSKEYEQFKKAVSPDLDVSATPVLVMGSTILWDLLQKIGYSYF